MLGRAREARAALAEALSLAPQNPRVLMTAGEVYEQLGDRELAIRWTAAAQSAGQRGATSTVTRAGRRARSTRASRKLWPGSEWRFPKERRPAAGASARPPARVQTLQNRDLDPLGGGDLAVRAPSGQLALVARRSTWLPPAPVHA
jgi:tetratricopeptide (TPR) repeat protein